MWKVTLINPPNTTYRVYLKGTATELGEGLILDATTAAFTGSKNQRGIENWSYTRSLYSGRVGLGKKEGIHLYFTGLYAKDDVNSIVLDSANNILTPKANYDFWLRSKNESL